MRRKLLVIPLLVCAAGVAVAGSVEQELAGCTEMTGEQKRLACFDALAQDVAARSKAAASGEAGTPLTRTFGLEHKDPNAGGASELRAVVAGIKKSVLGRMVLTLDNGQVWQQNDSKTLLLHVGDDILIERGALSAFYLSSDGSKRISVSRIK